MVQHRAIEAQGSIDSFKIFFEPGESEIGIHQAEFRLGMSPIKQNEHFGLEEGETPKEEIVKVDFAYIRDRTAADVRQVAGLLLDCARDIGQGDMAVFEVLIDDQLDLWRQMLNLRYFALQEQKGETITVNQPLEDEDIEDNKGDDSQGE